MTTLATSYCHPLFDDASLYRLATREGVFFDGGRRKVGEHFLGLRGDVLLEGRLDEVPKESWGYSPEVNRMLDDYLRPRAVKEKVPAEASLDELGGHPEVPPLPALLRFDLGRSGPLPIPTPERKPGNLFTGVGEDLRDLTEWQFGVSIGVGEGHEGRRCLALLFDLPCVRRLARALQREERWADQDERPLAEVIAASLNSDLLEPLARASPEERKRACGLALVLSTVPALEGVIRKGRFEALVSFELACPGPERGTCLALALGRRATSS
jgi:hypothetical protein